MPGTDPSDGFVPDAAAVPPIATAGGRLGPAQRAEALRRLATETFDVLVIGGGVTGAGTALDAAARGLSVALVEARDLAAGTSSRSSKLIHGGLRYLEQLNGALVREALRERTLLLETLAPHLVRPVPFLLPLTHHGWERAYIGSGVLLYDTLGQGLARISPAPGTQHSGGLPMHRHLTRKAALREFPALRSDALVGAIQYWDGQVDDARHTMFVGRTAARYGAAVVTSAPVVGLLREEDRVTGAVVRDLESPDGAEIRVRARQTIGATGVWTDDLHALLGGGRGARGTVSVRASKGVHLVVPRDRLQGTTGLILRTERSVLFVIPWGTHWIIGTTDTDWELDLAHPAATRADIDYLLDQLNRVLRSPLTRDDIVGVYAGLRPLLAGESEDTAQLSREHAVIAAAPGLTTVAGGKYTTYRVMAEDAVDAAVAGLTRVVPPSCTDKTPLLGADGYQALWNARERLAERAGLHVARIEHLLRRYGTLTEELVDLVVAEPSLGAALPGAEAYLAVEALYAVTHEGALRLEDVLTRRTRISFEAADRGLAAAGPVAELVAPVLGWDEARIRAEIELYEARVAAERASQEEADDATADVTRRAAPDARRLPSVRATARPQPATPVPADVDLDDTVPITGVTVASAATSAAATAAASLRAARRAVVSSITRVSSNGAAGPSHPDGAAPGTMTDLAS
ncbi:glycerol-3-phosphate dehydrogenase/oxidase [Frankia sp. AgB1.9]|uniref:glycerol-3-phosphate dehydrogenase/oxidase n=1 Tax=unclassified Frankia TaxID=2632575 RepID=UPI0019328615|nr:MULTISPECIES: glycerol-3-phosphate dehydrogenase/oxidase [unclassified Frankia]MBL7490947.1 glycerol-3-phosphate dehydrogenase/oxidase [Frankia sp. AgW1.1]MBL7550293.1 glycerol-3-phosphate dehydrogenase/oxidase [Frankia sp. AgB1.9]MBL7619130.1 glycerol-3-phosphate dehydrogenase/oxidase [Frankia sp. AgB1.8]